SEDPVVALSALYDRTRASPYAEWFPTVPTRADPERGHG
ncbi:MAG: DUF1028 domain-containing protein, partial [Rhodobacteraceae bacterium]|nr:DUF1028 domain-containing protein [Paracoccaceae bacterium]